MSAVPWLVLYFIGILNDVIYDLGSDFSWSVYWHEMYDILLGIEIHTPDLLDFEIFECILLDEVF